jgi:hypothetical protein
MPEYQLIADHHDPNMNIKGSASVSSQIIKFEIEKETKNSVRYKEVPAEGQAQVVGSLYVQKWFAGNTKTLQVTIEKKD